LSADNDNIVRFYFDLALNLVSYYNIKVLSRLSIPFAMSIDGILEPTAAGSQVARQSIPHLTTILIWSSVYRIEVEIRP
jgi:hypothetical protein